MTFFFFFPPLLKGVDGCDGSGFMIFCDNAYLFLWRFVTNIGVCGDLGFRCGDDVDGDEWINKS